MSNAISQVSSTELQKQRGRLKYFSVLFISSLTVVACISLAFYFTAQHSRQKVIEHQELFSISQQERIIRNDIKAIIADLLLLVNHHHLHSEFEKDDDNSFDTVAEEFLIFSQQKKIYDQVRFIDHTGMEQIRINYNDGTPAIVPTEKLQFKGERYYFKDTLKIQADEIFISPFDLNIEQGVIEEPRKPMIRFGAPVINNKDEKLGIIMLNYLGAAILEDMYESKAQAPGHRSLLNQGGYWLLGPDREKEWGFMYSDKSDLSLAHHRPQVWENMKQRDSGLLYENGDMYIFDTIYPLKEGLKSSTGSRKAYQQSTKSLSAHEYYWKIVSHIPRNELNRLLHPNFSRYLLANGLLALLIGVGCWLIAGFRLKQLQAEQNVKKSEQKFRTVADFSYDWDTWLTPDGRYAYVSPSCERVTGYPPKYFLDNPDFFLEIVHPDDRQLLTTHRLNHLKRTHEKDEVNFRIIMKSGEIRWIWHQCQPAYSEDGEWLGRRTTNRDVTEKHKIETALQRERDMFLHGPVATFTWQNREHWPVEQVSANVFDILGYKSDEFLDGSVVYAECIHPDDLDQVMQEVMNHSKSGDKSFIHHPYRLLSKSGETLWVLDTTTIVRDNNGKITHYLGYLVDISEQKRQEQLVLESSRQQEELKRLESLKTMAGAIAHRFNNAMMAVQGNLDLLTMTLPGDSNEHQMALSAAQAARGASQVGSMMLSYVGQNSLQLIPLSIADIVQESVAALKNQFQPSITLQFIPPEPALYCSADQLQIKEVIENILTNAIESLNDETGTIEITFGTDYFASETFPVAFQDDTIQDGRYVFCQIKDTGHGITPENLLRIFEPFYTTKFVGRGLGLALTVGIMQSHHGAITVESVLDQGTTVRLLLPVTASTQQTIAFDSAAPSETVQLSGNILLADDEEMVLEVGTKMLEILGFTVHTARNGQEALDKIRSHTTDFRAAVLDISMPVMDGIEAMDAIRKIDPALPILLGSGYSEEDLPSGNKPDAFLSKPFQLPDMQSSLEKLLS